tara:strand:- start:55895 stop:57211 length:1317 start_codon:yes stop_codon:yes gene_type:complete
MKMKKTIACAALGLSTLAFGQSNKVEFTEYDLPNGLHVILHQDNSTPIVAVTMMYHVGSKNEVEGRTGMAHFFEHLLFEGSENIARGEFDKYIENAGGVLNANTSQDRTFYYEILPSNQLELGLWLESERLMHAKIETKGIETQREVVKEEKRQRNDNTPYGSIMQESFSRAYTDHPYRWTPIGSMEDLNAATEQDFIDFYKTYYVPNNAVLSLAGDFNIADAKKMIAKYFSAIPKGTKKMYVPEITGTMMTAEVRDTVYDNIQLPAVIQTYRIPAQGTPDYYAVDLLGKLLSQGSSSRLQKALVDEKELALGVGAFPFGMEHPGVTLAYVITQSGVDPKDAEDAIQIEINKVQQELISEKELQKLKNQVEADFVGGNSRMAGIAESLANYHMYYGEANLLNTEIKRYLEVTPEDIKRVANKYFTPENRVVLYYLAKK